MYKKLILGLALSAFVENAVADEVITKSNYNWYKLETVADTKEYCKNFLKEHPEGTCSKNEQVQVQWQPNDPGYLLLGQENLNVINVQPAWSITKGENIVVAVIDSGIDLHHEDLKNQIALNTSGNRFNCPNSDIWGCRFDYLARDGTRIDVQDDIGHGTHVAGIIAAQANNGVGITGVAPSVKILPIKVYTNGNAMIYDLGEAIQYAIYRNVDVINISMGVAAHVPYLTEMIKKAQDANIVVVAAAGNLSLNLSDWSTYDKLMFPCQNGKIFDNVICVGASWGVYSNNSGREILAPFSNFGPDSVHILAPGVGILSTFIRNSFQRMDGTSMATPEVTAGVALMKSVFKFNTKQIRERLLAKVTSNKDLCQYVSSCGELNVTRAVTDSFLAREKMAEYAYIKILKVKNGIRGTLLSHDRMPIGYQRVGLYWNSRLVRFVKTRKNGRTPKIEIFRHGQYRFQTTFEKFRLTVDVKSVTIKY